MSDTTELPDEPEPAEQGEATTAERLREMPVGTNDPNIVGDAGPLDVPPGTDGDAPPEVDPGT